MSVEVAAPCMSCGGWRGESPLTDPLCASPSSHRTPESHQVWVLIGGHWLLKGTGATHPFVEDEGVPCNQAGHGKPTYVSRTNGEPRRYRGHEGGSAEWLYTHHCLSCDRVVSRQVCDGYRQYLVGLNMVCSGCGEKAPVSESTFFTPLKEE